MKIGSVSELLVDLLEIESISENEKEICDYVFGLLTGIGFNPVKIPVDKNGYNILVKFGRPKFYFSAHLDTVPPFIAPKITGTHISGRGSCDTKSSAAAMIKASYEARKKKLTNFGLIFTVGEETNGRGAKKMLKYGLKIPFVVCGEPTKLDLINSHYGLFEAKLASKGEDVYGTISKEGISAIDNLIDALTSIEKSVKRGGFPDGSLYNVSVINGGRAVGTVADYAEAYVDITVPPDSQMNIHRKIRRLAGQKAKVKLVTNWPSVETVVPKELTFLEKGKIANHASDLSFFQRGVLLGPGSIEISHTKRETVSRAQLRRAVKIYKKIIVNYQTPPKAEKKRKKHR